MKPTTLSIMSITLYFLLVATTFVSSNSYAQSKSEQALIERISSARAVCLKGEDCAKKAMTVASNSNEPFSAEQKYNQACAACHISGVAGAPMLGVEADWKTRLALSRQQLVNSVINGKGAMPAKGLCNDCSDEELGAIVDWMLKDFQ